MLVVSKCLAGTGSGQLARAVDAVCIPGRPGSNGDKGRCLALDGVHSQGLPFSQPCPEYQSTGILQKQAVGTLLFGAPKNSIFSIF